MPTTTSADGVAIAYDYAAWLASVIPTATVEVWADQGHYPHLVDGPRLVERLRSFESTLG